MAEDATNERSDRFIDRSITELQQANKNPIEGYEEEVVLPLEEAVEKLIPLISNISQYVDDAKNKCNKTSSTLTLNESAAIYLYTMPTCFFRLLNETLRAENRSALKPWFPFLKIFITALEKLPSSKLTVWRAVALAIDHFPFDNNMITWWGVNSTSTNINTIQSLPTEKSTLFTIEALNGKNITEYSTFPDEQEVILIPGTRLRIITSASNIFGNFSIVHLEECKFEQNILSDQTINYQLLSDDSSDTNIIDYDPSLSVLCNRALSIYYQSKACKITSVIFISTIIIGVVLIFSLTKKTSSNSYIITNSTTPETPIRPIIGTMNIARAYHTATLLTDGKVLVTGGQGSEGMSLTSAELYNPSTGIWTPTGNMTFARQEHTASLLADGQVLVTGGISNTAELYDPLTRKWTMTGSMTNMRYLHTESVLVDGKVLITGGYGDGGCQNSVELYDPLTGTWRTTGNRTIALCYSTASTLADGKVLVSGGLDKKRILSNSAELYDPSTRTWTITGTMTTARSAHTTSVLADGKVLVAGGLDSLSMNMNSAELYDPATGNWTMTGYMRTARYYHRASILTNGKVLVAGGSSYSGDLNSAELYDPSTGTWSITGTMSTTRTDHRITTLATGKVIVTGGIVIYGNNNETYLNITELYDPSTGFWSIIGNMSTTQ